MSQILSPIASVRNVLTTYSQVHSDRIGASHQDRRTVSERLSAGSVRSTKGPEAHAAGAASRPHLDQRGVQSTRSAQQSQCARAAPAVVQGFTSKRREQRSVRSSTHCGGSAVVRLTGTVPRTGHRARPRRSLFWPRTVCPSRIRLAMPASVLLNVLYIALIQRGELGLALPWVRSSSSILA